MDFSASSLWTVAAGLAVALEMATGTLYLLMVALGLAAGAMAAVAGLSPAVQLAVAAVVGAGSTAAWHGWRSRQPPSTPAHQSRDVNLDIGAQIQVSGWATDGSSRVSYRGSVWQARLAPGQPAGPGLHQVVAVQANVLVLAPLPSSSS